MHHEALVMIGCVIMNAAFAFINSPDLLPRRRNTHLLQVVSASNKDNQVRRTAPSEVVTLFDDFAERFEDKLRILNYTAPSVVARAASKRLDEHSQQGKQYKTALDAGCGTGLTGPHMRPLVENALFGVDLSPKMASLAAELVIADINDSDDGSTLRCSETARQALGTRARLYDGIFIADLLDLSNGKLLEGYGFTATSVPDKVDLIVSADVLCYFGELDKVLTAFSERLATGGDLIFSTETIAEGDYNWICQSSGRYAHDADYVASMAEKAGLVRVSQEKFIPRFEAGEEVLGTLHVFEKS